MRKKVSFVTVVLLLATVVLPLAGGVAAQDDNGRRPIVKFEGTVEDVPDGGMLGEWTIDGRTVLVVESTRFVETKGPAEVGATVVVLARLTEEGLEAMQIRVVTPRPTVVRIRGFITELHVADMYLVVNGLTVDWDEDTVILGELVVGAFVKITAIMSGSEYLATRIQVMPTVPRFVEFEGPITAMDDTTWEVAGQEITLDERTVIVGTPAVGRHAEVKALVQPDESLLAVWIKVKEEPEEIIWSGPIEKLPRRLLGIWVVAQRSVLVTRDTEISDEDRELLEVGVCVAVGAVQFKNRPLTALKIEIVDCAPAP